MTNPDLTLIGLLVDRSGSMSAIKHDMEGGIKTLLDDQRDQGATEVAIAKFDNEYELDTPITALENVGDFVIDPRGWTALNDSIGKFISYLGAELAARPEQDRPGTVIVNIITDGFENASKEWSVDQVKTLIEDQKSKYNWEFIFLGSDLSTQDTARGYGIGANRTIVYGNSAEGVDTGMNASVTFTRNIRGAARST